MKALELVIWSMALGAVAAVGLARLADLLMRPSGSQLQGVTYHAAVFVFVLSLSPVLATLVPALPAPGLEAIQVLAGPLCVALSNYGIRRWLGAAQRDRLMSASLHASAWVLPLAGLACLLLPPGQRLWFAAGVSLLGSGLTLWLTVRAWLMGDRLAPAMAASCALTLPAIGGSYAVALGAGGLAPHLTGAAAAAVGNALSGFVLWQRDRHAWLARQGESRPSELDPVTRLHTGIALVRKLIKAQRRRRRTRRDGAVLAILVFDVDAVAAQVGTAGLHEMFIAIGSRVQRQVGVVNPVGRYYERCFITVVEAIHSPAWLRTLGLRVAACLRQPIEVTGHNGERVRVRADIGVGVVHLTPQGAAVEDILHDAQRMAEAARRMPSRTAIFDAATGEVVPVEVAQLGPRRHGHPSLVPHAVPMGAAHG